MKINIGGANTVLKTDICRPKHSFFFFLKKKDYWEELRKRYVKKNEHILKSTRKIHNES